MHGPNLPIGQTSWECKTNKCVQSAANARISERSCVYTCRPKICLYRFIPSRVQKNRCRAAIIAAHRRRVGALGWFILSVQVLTGGLDTPRVLVRVGGSPNQSPQHCHPLFSNQLIVFVVAIANWPDRWLNYAKQTRLISRALVTTTGLITVKEVWISNYFYMCSGCLANFEISKTGKKLGILQALKKPGKSLEFLHEFSKNFCFRWISNFKFWSL